VRRDAALIVAALALCPLVAALAPGEPPLERTRALIDFERAFGLFSNRRRTPGSPIAPR
jgi:hypothetical protein